MIRCVWGHDVGCPRVELPRPLPPRALGLVRAAWRRWRNYFDRRHKMLAELLRSYRGPWKERRLFLRAWKRSESAELHARLAQFLIVHADIRTGEVGQLGAGGELRPFRFGEICDAVACSPGQLKRALRTFRAAGYLWRHQGRDFDTDAAQPYRGRVATIRLCSGFWSASGVTDLRQRWIRKHDHRARAAQVEETARDRYLRQASRDRVRQQILELAAGRQFGWSELEREVDRELERRRPPPTQRPPG